MMSNDCHRCQYRVNLGHVHMRTEHVSRSSMWDGLRDVAMAINESFQKKKKLEVKQVW